MYRPECGLAAVPVGVQLEGCPGGEQHQVGGEEGGRRVQRLHNNDLQACRELPVIVQLKNK